VGARLAWAALALLVAALFAALGFWQSGRADEKAQMLAARESARAAGPALLADALSTDSAALPVRIEGEVAIRAAPALLLDNQQRDGRVGVRAYALADAEGGGVVLVELGWLPLAADRVLPAVDVPAGQRRIEGLLLPWPGQGIRLADNPWTEGADTVLLAFLDREDVAAHLGVAVWDGILQPEPDPAFGYARDPGLLPDPMPPERHRGYAVQWWGLSLTVIITYLLLALRRKSR
jgi:cytochrome oxidase assembly protein ShyY1